MDPVTQGLAEEAIRTIRETGGVTLEGRTLLPATWRTGYMVGIGGIVIREEDLDSPVALAWLARRVGGEYMSHYVGFWLDEGLLYVDAVTYVADIVRAEALARNHGQKAIFNWGLMESQNVPLTEDHDR